MSEAVSEMDNLPNGWILVKIDYICKLIGGGTPSRTNLDYFNGDIVWLTPTEISKNSIQKIYDSKEKITKLGLKKSSARMIPINSVLLTTRASIGYVAIAGTNASTNQGFASFSCNGAMFNYYLAYWLWSKKNFLESEATGTTFKEISKSKLREIQIPLPPLAEQKHIVSKIESIFAQIDETRTRLEVASGMLNKLRSSVLRQAFEGRLVPQDPDDEPAEFPLKRVYKDSATVFEQDDLPTGWIKTTIGNIIEPSKERFDPISNTSRTFIGLEHIESNTGKIIEKGNSKELTSTKTIFRSGDVLYGRLRPYLNKACMPSFDGVCSTDILVFQKQPFLSNKFIALFLITNRFVTYANANMTGVQHPRISFKNIAKFFIFLPPYNEQKRIVSKIESIFTRIDAVERYVESTLRLLDLLKSSTLKQAFEGRLVPQDPDDEPAEFLLQIMKQEKQLIKSQKSSYGRKNVR